MLLFYFYQNFIEKFLWKKLFSNFDSIREMNYPYFGSCCWIIVVLDVNRYGESFVRIFQREST